MTIRPDSYGSVDEVTAFTKARLGGETAFNSTSQPTLTELEKFIDRSSATLNLALKKHGLTIPVTNSTAKMVCDDWVTKRAAEMVELAQPGNTILSQTRDGRVVGFRSLEESAREFATEMVDAFIEIGVAQTGDYSGAGLKFTGEDARSQRDDVDDTTLRRPRFERDKFDDYARNDRYSDSGYY